MAGVAYPLLNRGESDVIHMLTIKTFARACTSLASAGVKANDTAHTLGLFAISHALETGDIRPMDQVYLAMQQGRLRAEGFRFWVEQYSPIQWDKGGKIKLTKPTAKSFRPYDVEMATDNPFWTLDGANERPIKELSLTILQAMLAKALKKADELNDRGEIVNKAGEVVYQADPAKVVDIKNWAADARAKLLLAA